MDVKAVGGSEGHRALGRPVMAECKTAIVKTIHEYEACIGI